MRGVVRHPRLLGAAAGFGAGLLGTAISFDGPPAGAYGLYMGWKPRVFLGTLGVFFVIRGAFTVILQACAGFYTPEVLGYVYYGAPGVVLGTLLSFPVADRIPQGAFRRIWLVVIGVAGLVCLVRAFLYIAAGRAVSCGGCARCPVSSGFLHEGCRILLTLKVFFN